MSDEKKYSELEVAIMIRERLVETMKKHEDLSKNSAHDIDAGTDANNDEAECPDYLANSLSEGSESPEGGQSQESSESFSESSSEDSEESEEDKKKKKKDGESEGESEEHESSESDSEESAEEDSGEESEEKYDFKKSEAGMYTIEYKTLKKEEAGKVNPSFKISNPAKSKEWSKGQTNMINATKPGKGRKSDKGDQAKFESEAKARRAKMKSEGLIKEEVKATGGMDSMDKPHISDKAAEEKKGIKRPLEKCGDMAEAKSSSKLKKYLDKKK